MLLSVRVSVGGGGYPLCCYTVRYMMIAVCVFVNLKRFK